MKTILFISIALTALSCQRFHNKVQVLENSSSDTLKFMNVKTGESELVYPGTTYQMAFQEKLGKEEDGLPCNDINPDFEITTYSGESIVKSLQDEDAWTSTLSGDKDTEQECLFEVTDEDIGE